MTDSDVKLLFSGNIGIEYGQSYIDVTDFEEDDDEDYLDPEAAFSCGSREVALCEWGGQK